MGVYPALSRLDSLALIQGMNISSAEIATFYLNTHFTYLLSYVITFNTDSPIVVSAPSSKVIMITSHSFQ